MNKDYRFEVFTDFSSGNKEYVVCYFDFPNVIGVGDTIEEAIEEAEGNLKYYLEYCKEKGIFIPEPSVRTTNNFSGKITLRMSKSLHKKVDEEAKKEGISINSFVCEAISHYVGGKTVLDGVTNGVIDGLTMVASEYLGKVYEAKNNDGYFEKFNKTSRNKEIVV